MYTDTNTQITGLGTLIEKHRESIVNACAVAVLFVVLYAGYELFADSAFISAFAFFPFFRLGSCSCSSGSSGSSPGGVGDGDCTSLGIGNVSSTPFVSVWDGKRYHTENDVLVASKTWYTTRAEGKEQYKKEGGARDIYPLHTAPFRGGGKIYLQLKEFEPEESFVDAFTLSHITYPANGFPVQNTDNSGLLIFNRDEISKHAHVSKLRANAYKRSGAVVPISTEYTNTEAEVFLEKGEYISVEGKVQTDSKNVDSYILIRSRYRDWMGGTIPALESTQRKAQRSPFALLSPHANQTFAKTFVLFLAAIFAWTFGGHNAKTSEQSEIDLLAKTFSPQMAHASDSGGSKSLLITYWDWQQKEYVHIGTVHPRYKKATVNAVAVPKKALDADGNVRLRITATRRHAVSLTSLFGATETYTYRETNLPLQSAKHNRTGKDHTKQIATPSHEDYMHIVPGDVVNMEFADAKGNSADRNVAELFVVKVHGFYTPLSKDGAHLAGDWVSRLDTDARNILTEMYNMRAGISSETTKT